MMRIIALALALALAGPAVAADNAITLTVGAGVTMRSKDVGGGIQSSIVIPGDTSGNPLATAPGTGNSVFALPIQGVSGRHCRARYSGSGNGCQLERHGRRDRHLCGTAQCDAVIGKRQRNGSDAGRRGALGDERRLFKSSSGQRGLINKQSDFHNWHRHGW